MTIRVIRPGPWRRSHPEDAVLPAYLSPTEVLHTRASWPTAVMVVVNLPALAPPRADDVYRGLEPFSAVLAVLGVVALIGLLRRVDWGTPVVLTTAVLNVLLGEVALVEGIGQGLIGITLGLLALALATPVARHGSRF